jgi:hypothetical protein
VTELSHLDILPVLAKVAYLERDLVLVGGQAVNFWASYYERRVPELANEAPFTSKDIDFCGDQRTVRLCAERLGGKARMATFDDATPNSGIVVFVDAAGVIRTLDIVSAPFGLDGEEVRATALPVEVLDEADVATGARFYVMHPVLSMESRVHNVVGLAASYDTEQGRKQLRASILCAGEFLRDVLDRANVEGRVQMANNRTSRKPADRRPMSSGSPVAITAVPNAMAVATTNASTACADPS